MMKEQKGITLVALVITIIVMLILVGVSITVALNGGLFTNAKDAADAVTGTIELINRYENEFVPYVVWKPLALNDRSYETMKNKQDEFMEKMGFEL